MIKKILIATVLFFPITGHAGLPLLSHPLIAGQENSLNDDEITMLFEIAHKINLKCISLSEKRYCDLSDQLLLDLQTRLNNMDAKGDFRATVFQSFIKGYREATRLSAKKMDSSKARDVYQETLREWSR